MKRAVLFKDNLMSIQFDFDWDTISKVKSLSGRAYMKDTKSWVAPISVQNLALLKLAGFEVSGDVYAQVAQETKLINDLNALSLADGADFDTKLPLLPYQRAGAKFLSSAGNALLGDDVGLGKTLQSIAVVEADSDAERVLILCPAILKYQWESEIKKFLFQKSYDVFVIDGSAVERVHQWLNESKYIIANYELLLRDFDHMDQDWDYIIADECTRISNPSNKQTKALKKLTAKHRLALTGTPLSNHPHEIWSVIDWLAPGYLGTYWNFVSRYCIKDNWGSIHAYQHLDELAGRLKRYMIRRLKQDVLKELPDKIITDLVFKLSDEERKLYNRLKQEILFEIESSDISKIENKMNIQLTLVKMTRLRQLCDSCELLGDNTKSSKLEVLKELLTELAGKKIIIFSEFSQMCDILASQDDIRGAQKITGDTISVQREEILKWFKNQQGGAVLVMSSAGQFGLNLQEAEVIIHYDQPWSLSKLVQREGRAHRLGQEKKVLVYNLLAKGTLDMYVQQIIKKKQSLSSELLGDPLPSLAEIREMLRDDE